MRRFPTDRDIMDHVTKIECRRKNNCKSQCEQYCRRCTHNRNGSRMQDYFVPKIPDMKYL